MKLYEEKPLKNTKLLIEGDNGEGHLCEISEGTSFLIQ